MRDKASFKKPLLLVLLWSVFIQLGYGQSFSGKIVGTVTDSNGAILPGASVDVTSEGTGAKRASLTDQNGNYVVAELPVGFYSVRVEFVNFAPTTRQQVKVDVGAETRVDVVLKPQGLEQSVTVTEEAPVLQRDSSALAEVISNRQVDSLPINGRDFRRLTTLVPGAAPRSPRGSLGSFTVNGQREKSNIFLIDGVDNNDSFRNQPSFNQGGVTGAPATLFPVDALGEFNIQTQGAAEYGRNSGAILNIVIKSGTNEVHGTAYEFHRNDVFDARNFFETLPGAQKGGFKNNNFGGVLGGPIVPNRTFFFAGYEGQRERVSSPFAVRVPSASDLSAARVANAAAGRPEDGLSTRLLELFPRENNPGAANNLAFSATNLNDNDNFLAKIDHHFSERFTLSGRYIFGDGDQIFPLTSGFGSPLPPYQTVVPTRIQLVGVNLSQIINNSLINETRVSYNRFKQLFNPLDADFDPASLGLITGSRSLPTITVAGFVSLGAPTNLPRGRVSSAYQFVDNLTWTRKAHTIKMGGEYRRPLVNSFNDVFSRGRINFSSLADFLAERPSPAGTTIARGSTRRDTFTNNVGLFVQDDWKISPRLTLNLGLRYEYLGVFSDEGNRLSNFVPNVGLVRVGDTGLPRLYRRDWNNFGPRIGFAYDPTGGGRMVVRGGYGLYYDTPSQDYFLSQGFSAGNVGTNPVAGLGTFTVNFTQTVPFGPNVPIFGDALAPSPPFPLFAVDLNLRTSYIHNYNLNIQFSLSEASVLQLSYVGSRGSKLFRVRDINQPTPGPAATRQLRRPLNARFPDFASINYLETTANSNYNALQVYFRRRLSEGLTLFGAYTWSKSIDDASNGVFAGTPGVSFPQDSYNLRAERALSSYDVRHRFTTNFVYDLTFLPAFLARLPKPLTEGWQLSGIYTFATGLPITPFLAEDRSGTGELNDRPNLIGDPNSGPRRVEAFFNTAVFLLPPVGTFGNAGRNIIIGPRFSVGDFSVNKLTRINERVAVQFRSEFFNIFNHPNFSLPNVQFVPGSRAFGAISETPDVTAGNPRLGEGGPRVIQFGLKFIF